MRYTTLLALSVLSLVAWIPGPTEGSVQGPEDAPDVVEIRMVDKGGGQWRFEPAEVEVVIGQTVRFIMDDIIPHNVQFKDMPDGADLGSLVMGPFLIQKGDTYEVEVDGRFALGSYEYVCTPHEPLGMVASMTVVASTDR